MELTRLNRNVRILNWAAFVAIAIALVIVFFYAPVELWPFLLH